MATAKTSNETNNETPATTALATRPSVISALAGKLECDPAKLVPLLKKTAFATCKTDEEFQAMCMVANTYNLNPILKEIYAFPSKSGAVVPIVGVDGWTKLMNGNPAFDGIEFEEGKDYCTAIIYRKDRSHPVKVTEWLAECVGNTEPWKRWPKRMLRHKAMIQCARLAFGFAGIYDEDEGRRIAIAHGETPDAGEVTISPPPTVETPKGGKQAAKLAAALTQGKDAASASETPAEAQGGDALPEDLAAVL